MQDELTTLFGRQTGIVERDAAEWSPNCLLLRVVFMSAEMIHVA